MKALETMAIFVLLTLVNILIGTGYCLVNNSLADDYLRYVVISEVVLIPVSILITILINRKKLC